jgi:phospholipase C
MRLPPLLACAATLSVACSPQKETPVISVEEAAAARQACRFGEGARPSETLATSVPKGDQIPIDHIVMIMQENRSFDHYFSKLSHGGVDVAAPDATNPDADGQPVARFHQTSYCFEDPNHEWDGTSDSINGGRMDGFAKANITAGDPRGTRAMGYFDETDLPYYYALARTFAISDRHFCSVPGPTAPNRLYYVAATSFGDISNPGRTMEGEDDQGNYHSNIFLRLNDAGLSWKAYSSNPAHTAVIFLNTYAANSEKFQGLEEFIADARAGTLPAVSYVEVKYRDPEYGGNEHPSLNGQLGQKFVGMVVKELMNSPNWPRTALFVTYDEHGGFYDHVPPPAACKPDAYEPYDATRPDAKVEGHYDRLGPRVPLIAVSPWVKRGYVSHTVTDHSSLLRFIETRFDLPALTARDANAEPPLDMFDFSKPNLEIPSLPEPYVSPDACQ